MCIYISITMHRTFIMVHIVLIYSVSVEKLQRLEALSGQIIVVILTETTSLCMCFDFIRVDRLPLAELATRVT